MESAWPEDHRTDSPERANDRHRRELGGTGSQLGSHQQRARCSQAGGEVIKIEKMLELRLGKHKGDPTFQRFSDKLRALKDRMHENLITSIEFLKELLQMAKEVLEEEKKQNQPVDKRQKAKAALTELFESIRSKDTPIAVEAVVNDIDTQVVAIVRKFTDTFATLAGQNEVKRQLRSILWIKYKIKDNEVFEKAYKYIEMYY